MDVSIIDYYANHGDSFLHKAKPFWKIVFTTLVIASIILTNELYLLLGIYVALLSLAFWTRLSVVKIVTIALYPALFALIFAFAMWNGSWIRASVIMLKALSAALCMVLLIVTTPYPDVFNVIRPIMPRIIAEGLFVTYRSVFILLELTDDLIKGLKVRGGLTRRRYFSNIKNFSSGIGLLLVRGFDLSEKFYGVMNIRGYGGKISSSNNNLTFTKNDLITMVIGLMIFAAVIMTLINTNLLKLSVYVLLLSVCALIISTIYQQIRIRG
ncbi:MAG: energy-coupling factor transporter transmembrane component T [Thermodesulfobacteriota bacterium]